MVDRLPIIQPESIDGVRGPFPERSDEGEYSDVPGFEKGGGPPRRDRRRSRNLGQNVAAIGLSPLAAGFQKGIAIGDAQLAAWDPRSEDEEAETIVCYLKAYDFAEGAVDGVDIATATDPYSGVAAAGILPAGVNQSLIVLALLQWGHDGVSKKIVITLDPGQTIKSPIGASYVRAQAKLSVRYFPRLVIAAGPPATFTYLDLNANLRNNIFNAMGSPLLAPIAGVNFAPDTIPSTPIHVEGCLARGFPAIPVGAGSDRAARAVRKFYGTFPAEAAAAPAAGAQIFCPVAFGASSVMLQTNPTNFQFTAAGPINGILRMGMVDHAGNVLGEMPPNQFFPLNGAQSVFVYNTNVTQGELPFTLVYDMGL